MKNEINVNFFSTTLINHRGFRRPGYRVETSGLDHTYRAEGYTHRQALEALCAKLAKEGFINPTLNLIH